MEYVLCDLIDFYPETSSSRNTLNRSALFLGEFEIHCDKYKADKSIKTCFD